MHSNLVIDLGKIFKLFSGDSEISPFHDYYANEQTLLRNCAGRLFVHYNGEDLVQTYWALRKKAIICDTPERPLEISGPDSVAFLQMIFSRDVSKLKVGRGFYTLSCTHSGGTFMDGILFKLSDNKFWFVQPDGDMATWMLAHSNGFEINIRDPKSRVLQLQGPKSYKIMHASSNGAIDQNFGYYHSGFFRIGEQQVYVSRTGWTGELGYEIYTLENKTNYSQLWKTLLTTGNPHGMVFSSMQAMNTRRIEAGILDSGGDSDISVSPFEVGLGRFIDTQKGQFIGSKALKTKSRESLLYGIISENLVPAAGFSIMDNENITLAKVTAGTFSPHFKTGIGYARFYNSGPWIGKQLKIVSNDGSRGYCEIVELPFYDRKKALPTKKL